MLSLPVAVHTRLSTLSGGVKNPGSFFNVAPAPDNLPYRIVNQNPGTPVDFSSDQDEITETVTILVHVYDHDAVWVYEDLERIQKSFVTTTLVLDSGRVILTEPGSHTVDVDPDRDDETGKEVYHGVLITDFTVQRRLKN